MNHKEFLQAVRASTLANRDAVFNLKATNKSLYGGNYVVVGNSTLMRVAEHNAGIISHKLVPAALANFSVFQSKEAAEHFAKMCPTHCQAMRVIAGLNVYNDMLNTLISECDRQLEEMGDDDGE